MSLVNSDVATAVTSERTQWNNCVGNRVGAPPAGFANDLVLADLRVRTALVNCVFDAARRMDASQNVEAHPQRTCEAFMAAAIGLSVLAVSSPSSLDSQHVTDANFGFTSPLTNGEVAAAFQLEQSGFQGTIGADKSEGPGGAFAKISETADHTGWRLRSRRVPCLNDASRRMAASLGWTPNPRTPEHFTGAALRLALLAVSSPSQQDTLHLQIAGLA